MQGTAVAVHPEFRLGYSMFFRAISFYLFNKLVTHKKKAKVETHLQKKNEANHHTGPVHITVDLGSNNVFINTMVKVKNRQTTTSVAGSDIKIWHTEA